MATSYGSTQDFSFWPLGPSMCSGGRGGVCTGGDKRTVPLGPLPPTPAIICSSSSSRSLSVSAALTSTRGGLLTRRAQPLLLERPHNWPCREVVNMVAGSRLGWPVTPEQNGPPDPAGDHLFSWDNSLQGKTVRLRANLCKDRTQGTETYTSMQQSRRGPCLKPELNKYYQPGFKKKWRTS